MKLSYKWLCDYVDFSFNAQELSDALSLLGHEVEGIDTVGEHLSGIITGKIVSIDPHPNADRLVVTQVTDGTHNHQIVTGAQNISVHDIVPVSLPGAILANGMAIKSSKLRGVESHGMLCSEAELGMAEDADGILVLPSDTPIGIDFIDYAQLKDWVLDVSILPNRGDCQSVIGIARDVAAFCGTSLKKPDINVSVKKEKNPFSVSVKSPVICPYYSAHYITNYTPQPSPIWMQRRLQLGGIRPLSLAVDVTNYVLLEFGQPLHAFDAARLKATTLNVRQFDIDTSFTTLDNEKRHCAKETLFICDGNTPVAIAGIMGGKDSEISPTTSTLLLEAAFFDAVHIRKTANALSLRTESAVRFEKGVDPEQVMTAAKRALHLLQKIANVSVSETVLEDKDTTYKRFQPVKISFSIDQINGLLGTHYERKDVNTLLSKLGITIKNNIATIPSWRNNDIEEWPCLAEEVCRMKGLESIPSTLPVSMVVIEEPERLLALRETLATYFVQNGFCELNTFPLISQKDCDAISEQTSDYVLSNPLTIEESVMRPSMMPSLLKAAAYNLHRQHDAIQFFETDKIYSKKKDACTEDLICAGMMIGNRFKSTYFSHDNNSNLLTMPYLKQFMENALMACKASVQFSTGSHSLFHPKKQLSFDSNMGTFGQLHPTLCETYGIDKPVWYFEINVTALSNIEYKFSTFKPYSRYPSTRRDIALLVPKELSYDSILAVVKKYKPKIVTHFFLFDYFESEKIGLDKKSIAIGFIYQDLNDTLADEKVNQSHERLCGFIQKNLPVTIR